MTEQTKYCMSCGNYKPLTDMKKKKVTSQNGKPHTIVRCVKCWELRGR